MTSTGNTPAVATSPGSPPSAFTSLREANVARQAEWDTSAEGITLAYAGNELAGEVGEACNLIKKLERERLGIRGSRATVEQLAEELADVVICTDLIALRAGIDLDAAVVAKFNATSEKVGLSTRLARAEAAEARLSALTAERDRMAEALKPFAEFNDGLVAREATGTFYVLDVHGVGKREITAEDFGRARQALQSDGRGE